VKPVRARSLLAQLAAEAPRPASSAPAREPGRRGPRPAEGARVLLAEDNEINALLARKALERLGAEVIWARDGVEAVERAREALETGPAFDLALLDIRMPRLDGLGAVHRIRADEAERGAARLTVVALTANALAEDERAARDAGFDGFLSKPLELAALPALFARRAAA
jgi:CheY-like chemotaxis protein